MRITRIASANVIFFLLLGYVTLRILEILLFKRPIFGLIYLLLIISSAGLYLGILRLLVNRIYLDRISLLIGLLLFISGCFALFMQYNFNIELFDNLGRSSFGFARSTFIVSMLWMLAGFVVANTNMKKSNVVAIIVVLMAGWLVISNLSDGIFISYRDLTKQSEFDEINHLTIAEYMLIMLYFAYSISYGLTKFLILFLIPIIMFSLGGRSSFFFGTFSIVLFEFLCGNLKITFAQLFLVGIVLLSVTIIADTSNPFVERMLLSHGLSEDRSLIARIDVFWIGVEGLGSQVWFGDPGFLIHQFGSMGTYIHNGLSAWQFYGIGFFLTFVAAIVLSIRRFWMSRWQVHQSSFDIFRSLVLVYAVLGIVLTKFVGFFFIWFAIGLWLGRSQNHVIQLVKEPLVKNSRVHHQARAPLLRPDVKSAAPLTNEAPVAEPGMQIRVGMDASWGVHP